MRIERDLMRGAGPVEVLKLLETRPMYGYELVEELAKQSGGILNMGQSTLYPLLYNLESQNLIRPSWKDAPSGRKRKYYALTGKGEKRLSSSAAQWKAVTEAMAALHVIGPGVPALAGDGA